MQDSAQILLPGGFKQFRILKSKYIVAGKSVLVIGSGSEKIAEKMIDAGADSVKMIVSDSDSLLSSRLNLKTESRVTIKMMDFSNTDFKNDEFDLVYAQAAASTINRNKIVKEIKRILNPSGVYCVSEITALAEKYPAFIKDIFETSGIIPLMHDACKSFYSEKNLTVLYEEDISSSLKSFYENTSSLLKNNIDKLTDNEKSYYKKLLHKISHESNAYLKLGSDKFIGFKLLILKKEN